MNGKRRWTYGGEGAGQHNRIDDGPHESLFNTVHGISLDLTRNGVGGLTIPASLAAIANGLPLPLVADDRSPG